MTSLVDIHAICSHSLPLIALICAVSHGARCAFKCCDKISQSFFLLPLSLFPSLSRLIYLCSLITTSCRPNSMRNSLTYIAYRKYSYCCLGVCLWIWILLFIYMETVQLLCRVKFTLFIPLIRSSSLHLFYFSLFVAFSAIWSTFLLRINFAFIWPWIQLNELPCWALISAFCYALHGLLSIKTKDLQHKIHCQAIVQQYVMSVCI